MSRIKDLLAEEENIDDLKVPVHFGKDLFAIVSESDAKRITAMLCEACKGKWVKDVISHDAQYGFGTDEEGHTECYIENYLAIIGDIVEEKFDDLIAEQHLDLMDCEYNAIKDAAVSVIADFYADYESECCQNLLNDDKFKLTELKERNGEC